MKAVGGGVNAGAFGSARAPSPVQRVRLRGAPPQPWRNGGGVTRELLAWGPGGDWHQGDAAATWTLRVSVADIAQDGPFSAFAGIDRCFAVLEGAGVVLTLSGVEHRLTPGHPPVRFDGALAPGCRLIDGPTRDLNLMVQGDAGRLRMQRAAAGQHWGDALPWRALYTHAPARLRTAVPGDGTCLDLPGGTLAWSDDGLAPAWTLLAGTQAWWLGCLRGGPP